MGVLFDAILHVSTFGKIRILLDSIVILFILTDYRKVLFGVFGEKRSKKPLPKLLTAIEPSVDSPMLIEIIVSN